jgi:tRNA(adenine34) deaminase
MNNVDIDHFMNLALIEAKKAKDSNEVPIGAIVVNNDKTIVAKGFNQTESTSNPIAHAEMIAIERAANQNKDWRLNDFTLFSTLEPCPMCLAAAKEARINRIYFGCESNNKIHQLDDCMITNLRNLKSKEILKSFFKKLR